MTPDGSAIPPIAAAVGFVGGVVMMNHLAKMIKGSPTDKGDSKSKQVSSSKSLVDREEFHSTRGLAASQSEKRGEPQRLARYAPPETQRERYKRVAEKALQAIDDDSYPYRGNLQPLNVQDSAGRTVFFAENSKLADWKRKPESSTQSAQEASLSVLNVSTLDAARILSNSYRFQAPQGHDSPAPPKTGVLNFASATKEGGGFINGADAQEESIARASTLYASLTSVEAAKFYAAHSFRGIGKERSFYTHGMIYSPGVVVFQNDMGDAVDPYTIEVVSSAAVNAGELHSDCATRADEASLDVEIEAVMDERMGRILYLFEIMGVRNIVLGTFGTGVFKNDVQLIARLWARLLVNKTGRFRYSFDRVVFAITGDETFAEFYGAFRVWMEKKDTPRAASGVQRSEWAK